MKILITADWHIKGERPICRMEEDWLESQRQTIEEIRQVFNEGQCNQIWILGDIFDTPRCSTTAVNMLIDELTAFPENSVRILCGNHDLKDHSYKNLQQCSIGTLLKTFSPIPQTLFSSRQISVSANAFGQDDETAETEIVCTHQLTFPNDAARPMPGCGLLAQDLLDKWKTSKIIFTGDYHNGYIFENDSRFVVTPGCINIQKADELNYKPFVVIWDTEKTGVDQFEVVYLNPQNENCTRDHIEYRKQKDLILSNVIETIQDSVETTLDFDSNLEKAVNKMDLAIINEYNTMKQELGNEK